MSDHIISEKGYRIPLATNLHGERSVCVIVHGFGSSKESPTAQMLMKGLPEAGIGAVSFDLPAHGASEVDGEYLRLENCLADMRSVERFARETRPEARIFFFGSSFGAYCTLLYFANSPRKDAAAYLRSAAVNMPALFHSRTPEEEAELARCGYVTLGENYGYQRPLKIMAGFLEDLDANDVFSLWKPGLADIRMIHGTLDETIDFSEAERFANQFDIPLTVVPGGDHRLSGAGMARGVLAGAIEFYKDTLRTAQTYDQLMGYAPKQK